MAQLTSERELRERFVMTLAHDLRTPLAVVKIERGNVPASSTIPRRCGVWPPASSATPSARTA